MVSPRVCVLRAPGTNCDVETAFAFESCGARADRVHVFRLIEDPALLNDYQVLCIPGGFSYGDDIGAGVVFSRHLRNVLHAEIGDFLAKDRLALGICNGFQVLLKSGLLPDGAAGLKSKEPAATLTWNDSGKYTALWVRLGVLSDRCVFFRGLSELELPIAHAEGKLVVRDEAIINAWREHGQIALAYQPSRGAVRDTTGEAALAFPQNPNGSTANVAGLCDPTGRVLGLMPHPERFLHATNHPQWTRRRLSGEGQGMAVFRNAVEYFR